jgi:hypothetical protein
VCCQHQVASLAYWWTHTPWLLPTFPARATFSLRQVISIVLSCAWVFSDDAARLFVPGILVPVAAVSGTSLPPWLCTRPLRLPCATLAARSAVVMCCR